MKRATLIIVVLFVLTGCSAKHMTAPSTPPSLDPGEDKATLVILRDTIWGHAVVFSTYLEKKFIGETRGKTYFVTKVDPGERYVITVAENTGVAKINFEPAKIYFLNQNVTMGWWKARTSGFTVAAPDQASASMSSSAYYKYDEATNAPDLKQSAYDKAVKEYEAGVAKDASAYGDIVGYRGMFYSEFSGRNNQGGAP